MRPRCEVVVFARAPVLGAVKTRLAEAIGDAAARRAYREMTGLVLRQAASDSRWRTWIAVSPDCCARKGRFWPAGIPRLPQGTGGLGRRMAHALSAFPRRPVIVVGTDIPAISRGHIAAAFAALAAHDYVFGPALDGGYWLVGAAPGRPVSRLFDGVRWSAPHALADTLANIPSSRRYALLDTLEDVDDAAALARWRERAEKGSRNLFR